MTSPETPSGTPAPVSRAGRNLPAAIGSALVLLALIGGSLYFWKAAFVGVVAAAIVLGWIMYPLPL
jgi:phosphatidate cytidylyltransferase